MTDTISLADLNARLDALDRRLTELRSEDNRRFEDYKGNIAKALELQASTYERRLADLNHAYVEAKRIADTYVTHDLYNKDMEKLARVESQLSTLWRIGGLIVVIFTMIVAGLKLLGAG